MSRKKKPRKGRSKVSQEKIIEENKAYSTMELEEDFQRALQFLKAQMPPLESMGEQQTLRKRVNP
jgi:ribosomal protein RSM22 (predicted rRNA methylase)